MEKVLAYLSFLVPQSLISTAYLFERLRIIGPDPNECDHEWEVVAGIFNGVELQVSCRKCMTYSEVPDPTEEEWVAATAMTDTYPWYEESRIRYYSKNGGSE
jgi:hypothetical protein